MLYDNDGRLVSAANCDPEKFILTAFLNTGW